MRRKRRITTNHSRLTSFKQKHGVYGTEGGRNKIKTGVGRKKEEEGGRRRKEGKVDDKVLRVDNKRVSPCALFRNGNTFHSVAKVSLFIIFVVVMFARSFSFIWIMIVICCLICSFELADCGGGSWRQAQRRWTAEF